MKKFQLMLFFLTYFVHGVFAQSISDEWTPYLDICRMAVQDDKSFRTFRSDKAYFQIVEYVGNGVKYDLYLRRKAQIEVGEKLPLFQRLDTIGGPKIHTYQFLGDLSSTTIRYIAFADHLIQLFGLPPNSTIAEIGAGFGGQCYILSCIQPFHHYYIYDIPEAQALIEKVLNALEVQNFTCVPIDSPSNEVEIDLVISNYAFSECSLSTQLDYFDTIIKKAKRGYFVYNYVTSIAPFETMSVDDFVARLKNAGKKPRVMKELLGTRKTRLIVWD